MQVYDYQTMKVNLTVYITGWELIRHELYMERHGIEPSEDPIVFPLEPLEEMLEDGALRDVYGHPRYTLIDGVIPTLDPMAPTLEEEQGLRESRVDQKITEELSKLMRLFANDPSTTFEDLKDAIKDIDDAINVEVLTR